jgi:DNA adenine methylase
MTLALSPLRYPGGKSKALDQILPLIPRDICEFREPFVGGGSVFLAIRKLYGRNVEKYWINDLNQDLIHFWQQMRDAPEDLIAQVESFKAGYENGRELYTFLLDDNNMRSSLDRATRFFIMNRITFSGVMDAGGYSQQAFDRRFTDSCIERLHRTAHYLPNVSMTCGDYEPLLAAPGDDVFIFLDPPYYSATKSKLYGKRGKLHTEFDHERFAAAMKACPHRWLITYDDSERVRSLFGFAEIVAWELQYGMNNFGRDYAPIGREVFIKNF